MDNRWVGRLVLRKLDVPVRLEGATLQFAMEWDGHCPCSVVTSDLHHNMASALADPLEPMLFQNLTDCLA